MVSSSPSVRISHRCYRSTIVGKGVLSMGLFCEALATLNVGVRVTIMCHDLCNNRVISADSCVLDGDSWNT